LPKWSSARPDDSIHSFHFTVLDIFAIKIAVCPLTLRSVQRKPYLTKHHEVGNSVGINFDVHAARQIDHQLIVPLLLLFFFFL
jgi:hypothetical protein